MGYTWGETQPAGETTKNWTACKSNSDGSYLVAITGNKLYLSRDSGLSWEWNFYFSSGSNHVYAMSNSGAKMIAGVTAFLFRTIDGGINWNDEWDPVHPHYLVRYPGYDNPYVTVVGAEISGDGSKFFVGVSITHP